MANYRKSFNFRNGVQVDEDNLIVNSNGLVGIGTSVPTEVLDVRGTAKVVGLITANHIFTPALNVTGVGTFGTITDGKVTINSGIITALSGLVTFYGDGRGLVNIPTSQWIDTDVGFGFTSIYAAGNVGVATTNPTFTFQVGDNPNTGSGVGFNSTGDIKASGIVTATTFVGNITGNVTGQVSGNVNSTGVSTFTTLKVGASVNIGSGIVTATTFIGNLTGNVTGTASTASSLTGTPNIQVGIITATKLIVDVVEVPNTGITTISKLLHVGTSGTAFSALEGGRIGVGTAVPTSEFQIRKASGSLLEVISETGSSRVSIGQSVGVGRSTAVLRFGDTDKTFDIVNNDTGNINLYLHNGPSGVGTGRFEWLYGQTNAQLMSLTYGGRLGLGKTNPDETLHVVGTSTVTSNAYFGSNVTIAGNLTAGSITLPSILTNTNLSNTSGVSTVANLLVAPVGVGSIGINTTNAIAGLDARAVDGLFNRIGVNTTILGNELLTVNGAAKFSSIGIGTSASSTGIGLILVNEFVQRNSTSYYYDSIIYVSGQSGVGVGTTAARSAVDFADAGKTNAGLLPGEGTGSRAYFLPPRLTTTQRIGLATEAGAIIYNTSTNRHQGYNGTSWNDLY